MEATTGLRLLFRREDEADRLKRQLYCFTRSDGESLERYRYRLLDLAYCLECAGEPETDASLTRVFIEGLDHELERALRLSVRDLRSLSLDEVMVEAQYFEGQLRAIGRGRAEPPNASLLLMQESGRGDPDRRSWNRGGSGSFPSRTSRNHPPTDQMSKRKEPPHREAKEMVEELRSKGLSHEAASPSSSSRSKRPTMVCPVCDLRHPGDCKWRRVGDKLIPKDLNDLPPNYVGMLPREKEHFTNASLNLSAHLRRDRRRK
jgi:hypothetical protein